MALIEAIELHNSFFLGIFRHLWYRMLQNTFNLTYKKLKSDWVSHVTGFSKELKEFYQKNVAKMRC